MSQSPVLPSLASPVPTGPLSFEDTPQPTVPEQQQPVVSPHAPQLSVVPSSVAEPALDAPDATLQSVQHQIDEATAAAGHSPSSSDSEADGSQFVVAPSSTASGPPSSPAPDA
ncbi:predicted GPI-anchored protein 58 [Phragmites australis]|uniref:predicted GPI-anchored protein 58 n=1 Tax=Phragmites australis TaxID=29695 RepID=UPI002D783048|nr:predicted GPI-anchored protein 58 [Phragmites australis]